MYNTFQAVSALHAQVPNPKLHQSALTLSKFPNQKSKSSANLYTVGAQVKRQSVNNTGRRERERETEKEKGK
jgi:hypothetical protein